jgi:serine/threonine-protein kinase RsbW
MQDSRSDSTRPTVPRTPMQDDWHVSFLSSVYDMAVIIDRLATEMKALGYNPRDIFGARLALEEAICNAIKHGHRHDPSKLVEIRYRIRETRFLVEVEDEGPGFVPSQVADATAPENLERPSGRGLLLMRANTAWVRHNPKGNCVTFCIYPSVPRPTPQPAETLSDIVPVSSGSTEP